MENSFPLNSRAYQKSGPIGFSPLSLLGNPPMEGVFPVVFLVDVTNSLSYHSSCLNGNEPIKKPALTVKLVFTYI